IRQQVAIPVIGVGLITDPQQAEAALENGNVPPQPQLEQANQSLVAQSGAQEYAPHVINTPLAFLIKSACSCSLSNGA
ncbi:hypothetical protein FK513_29685, partial [Klebsiella pneumoniae]|nr:hypothetical protein [Klebsiella pneumoniae]